MFRVVLNTVKTAALGAIALQVARSATELTQAGIEKGKETLEKVRGKT